MAAVNSALQRARATLANLPSGGRQQVLGDADAELLERYVEAFESYDIERLVTLLQADAVQSMPPFALWIQGATDIGRWMVEPGPSAGAAGSLSFPPRPTAARPSGSTGRIRRAATLPGRSRCWSFSRGRSPK